MEISDPNYAHTMAKVYADLSAKGAQDLLASQKGNASRTQTGLSDLRKALNAFDTALGKLAGGGGGLLAHSATVSNPALGSATVGAGAAPGSYTFRVQQLASNHQLASGALGPVTAGAGNLGLNLADGSNINVNLGTADGNNDGQLSPAEIARAINQAAGGKLSASTLTVNGQQQLVLSSSVGGADGEISIDTSGLSHAGLATALGAATELSAATNAVFFLGGAGGTRIEQGSNTFTGIAGVALTFSQAASDVSLQVSRDEAATKTGVQSFIDAYNALKTALDGLTRAGDLSSGDPGGAFSADPAVIGLQRRLNDLLRQPVGGVRLLDLGISADRNGTLQLDSKRLTAALERDPDSLDAVLGNGGSGLGASLSGYLDGWLSGTDGQLKKRQDSTDSIQKALNKRETAMSDQYDRIYSRYLAQFTQVQTLNSQMEHTLSLIDSLLVNNDK